MSAAVKLKPAERRSARRVHLGNVIAHADIGRGREPIMVCVWDLSVTGACVLVPPDVIIPDQFKLMFDHVSQDARVVWRTWSHVGITFDEQA